MRQVQEVSEIFQDLALLVDEQGTHIDNIQTNIESAATQTERGVQELHKANKHQKKARSRMQVRLSGSWRLRRAEQPAKARTPIELRPAGSATVVRE